MAENLVQQHCWTEAEVLQGCNVCWVGNYTAGTGDKGKSYSTQLCSLYRKLFRDRWLQRTAILRDETLPFPCVCVYACAHINEDLSQSFSGFPGQCSGSQLWLRSGMCEESPPSPLISLISPGFWWWCQKQCPWDCTQDYALGLLQYHRGSNRISVWTWEIKMYFLSGIP